MTPRRARPDEAAALRDLVRDAYAEWVPVIGREPGPMTDDYAARIAAGEAWVVEADGGLAAALILEDEDGALLLDNIAIAPSARGRGLFRDLMAFAAAEARRRGHPCIRLYTHERMARNVTLYAALGYVETHRAEQDGFARVFMEKPL
ncbi:GNAT family N-acetyltransferase [Neoroseomonas oryzicola]|uniref:GNAT family N-acetyltransferase n=1 Tax=Neoroseomonas oryzicola TaxID=535904 RepID=A0A9X9WLG8_9PROT|nr:GNAT family N-acetyltransferase [Neoroseomonas oryzicola]NKE17543.1 GNAT family N-acetyltransferase [Neoroseomonas oryzicola]